MSAREPITEAFVQRLLIGVTPGEWRVAGTAYAKGCHIVADGGVIVGGIRKLEDARLTERAADIAEWALRELRERDRRIAELTAQLDEATRTEDEEPTFAEEMADVTTEEH